MSTEQRSCVFMSLKRLGARGQNLLVSDRYMYNAHSFHTSVFLENMCDCAVKEKKRGILYFLILYFLYGSLCSLLQGKVRKLAQYICAHTCTLHRYTLTQTYHQIHKIPAHPPPFVSVFLGRQLALCSLIFKERFR